MSDWRCGQCKKIYSFDDFMKLAKTQMKDDDPDPKKNYGYTSVCPCGYKFHKDKWMLKEKVEIKNIFGTFVVEVSTVDLEMEHMGGMYYETMVFPQEGNEEVSLKCHYQNRYRDKDDAIKGHEEVVKKLKEEKFTASIKEVELVLE